MRVGFGDVPIILSGLLLGSPAGGFVGLAADLSGAILFPSGPFFPGFTFSALLVGFLPAFLVRHFKKKEQVLTRTMLFLSILCTQLIASAFLNTLWIVILYMSPLTVEKYLSLFFIRAPFSIMMSFVYTIIVYPLFTRITKENL